MVLQFNVLVHAETNKLLTLIPLGGGADNTVYNPGSGHILVAVHGVNELVAIDPAAMKIIGRYRFRESRIPMVSGSTLPTGLPLLPVRRTIRSLSSI